MKNKILDFTIRIITNIISFLDRFERDDEKIIHTFDLDGIQIHTDAGFQPISHIHLTKPFEIYKITLENGYHLECADEHIVFDRDMKQVFVQDLNIGDYIQTDTGPQRVIAKTGTSSKICMCDVTVNDKNHRYYSNGILSHNTTTSAIFILHFACFNIDKNALVLGNKRRTACDILDKFKDIFYELPYFLKAGVFKWNESSIALDNGCRVKAEATTINSGIGNTIHCCLMDEFAHIQPNIIDKFYNNLLPVVTAGKGKVIITSTQNGFNLFYRLWSSAVANENDYKPFEVTWDMIPEWNPEKRCWEKRDEAWHQRWVANLGSEEAFNAQFGTCFDISSNTLIDNKIIKKNQVKSVLYINKDLDLADSSDYFWHPDIDPDSISSIPTCITIDISEGIGGDYTVFTFNRLKNIEDNVHTEAYAFFKCNKKNVQECAQSLKRFCMRYMDMDNFVISLEYNLYGELFVKCMLEEIEKDMSHQYMFNEDVFLKYYNEEGTRFTMGKKVTAKSKALGLTLFKNKYERGIIQNTSAQFFNELMNFCDTKGNNTFQASFGHDDLVMSQVHIVFAMENSRVKELAQKEEMIQTVSSLPEDTYIYLDHDWMKEDMEKNISRLNRMG